jgi:hypothetical protein
MMDRDKQRASPPPGRARPPVPDQRSAAHTVGFQCGTVLAQGEELRHGLAEEELRCVNGRDRGNIRIGLFWWVLFLFVLWTVIRF